MANFLTLSRIALIIPFAAAFMANAAWNLKIALAIFIIAALTDLFDGWVARARNEATAFGAALDPIADKLLVAAALILLVRNGVIHGAEVIAVIIIILREILISGLREAVARKGDALPVSAFGKWKAAAQLVAAALFLAAAPTGLIGESIAPLASGFLWLAAILTFWSGADYALRGSKLLRSGR